MSNSLFELQQTMGYVFRDLGLLRTALTHSSFANENKCESNERMEFLGDSILNFLVAEKLFESRLDAGEMTVARAAAVSRNPLAKAVEKLGALDYLRLGVGAEKEKHVSVKFKSDIFECLIGAIYLDSRSLDECRKFIFAFLSLDGKSNDDYKSRLQEYVQDKQLGTVKYCTRSVGEGKTPWFKSKVSIDGKTIGSGYGCRKKEAEKDAAQEAYNFLTSHGGK